MQKKVLLLGVLFLLVIPLIHSGILIKEKQVLSSITINQFTRTNVVYKIDKIYPIVKYNDTCFKTLIANKSKIAKDISLSAEDVVMLNKGKLPYYSKGIKLEKDYTKENIICHNKVVGDYKWGFSSSIVTVFTSDVGIHNNTLFLNNFNSVVLDHYFIGIDDDEILRDTYVRDASPTSGAGALPAFAVGNVDPVGQNNATSHLMYDLSAIPLNSYSNYSEICLYVDAGGNAYEDGDNEIVFLYGLNNYTWLEDITFNTKPPGIGALLSSNNSLQNSDELWVCFNGTDWVNDRLENRDSNISFVLNATSDYGERDNVAFTSKEYTLDDSLIHYLYISANGSSIGEWISPIYNLTANGTVMSWDNTAWDSDEPAGTNISHQGRCKNITTFPGKKLLFALEFEDSSDTFMRDIVNGFTPKYGYPNAPQSIEVGYDDRGLLTNVNISSDRGVAFDKLPAFIFNDTSDLGYIPIIGTVAFWLKVDYYGTGVNQPMSGAGISLMAFRSSGLSQFAFRTNDTCTSVNKFGTAPTGGEWTHVVFRKNETTLAYFKNGIEVAQHPCNGTIKQVGTGACSGISDSDCFRFGGTSTGSTFNGTLDSIRFYKGALTNDEITTLFNEKNWTDYTTKDYSSPDDMNLNGTHCQSKITYESSVPDYPSLYNLTIYYSDIGVEVPPVEPTSCQDGHTTNCTFPNSFSLDKEINLTCLCNISDVSWARNISFVGTGEINVSTTISFYNISPLTAGSIGWISTNAFMNQTH